MKKQQIYSTIILSILICILIFISVSSNSEKLLLSQFLITTPFVIYHLTYKLKFLSSSFLFVIFYIMLFFIQPIFYLLIDNSYLMFSIYEIKVYSLLANIGILLFLIGYQFFWTPKVKIQQIYVDKQSIDKAVKILLITTIISLMICFIDAGTLNLMNLSRLELKGNTGPLRLLATFGLYITSILFFLVFFTMKARKNSNIILWVLLFLIIEILVFLLFRTRSLIVSHSLAVMIGYYYSNFYAYNIRKSLFSPKLTIIILSVILFITSISMRFFRGYLQPDSNVESFNFDLSLFLEESITSGDIGYSGLVMRVIHYVTENDTFLHGQSYYRLLFTVIPRSLWDDKPENTQQIVADWLEPGTAGLSLPPGIIGDMFINFGVIGILLMVLFGMFFSLFDRKMYIHNFLLWGTSATWIFHLVRGGFTNPIIIFLALFICILWINRRVLKYDKPTEVYESKN